MNSLHFGDNLDVLRERIKDESVNLVYLDPPFNSNATYNVLFKESSLPSEAQAEAFRDTWGWGEAAAIAYDETMRAGGSPAQLLATFRSWFGESAMTAYLSMMAVRLIELHRVLKPTGSLYLHCDPTASHYLKMILDSIFGPTNFRNEIIWKRTFAHSGARRWGDIHDCLLFYSASDKYTWNRINQKLDPDYVDSKYRFHDERGQYRLVVLTGPGTRNGASGQVWRGYDPTSAGRHWAVPRRALEIFSNEGVKIPVDLHEQLDLLHERGFIRFPQKKDGAQGVPEFKLYLPDGQPIQDIIFDVPPINSQARERLGYPTQKPIALVERIIQASTSEGDVVLDPFCGCGTSIEAAERLGRQWIGIDVTHYAITLIEKRLAKHHSHAKYAVYGRPTDLAGARDLARRDKYQFQWWAAWLLGAQTYESKRGADRGIDANIYFSNGPYGHGRIIVSVKGGEHVSPAMVRELSGVVQREPDANMGILVTLVEPTKSMLQDAAGAGFVERSAHGRLPRVQVVTVADLLDGRFPKMPPLPQPISVAGKRKTSKTRDKDQLELLLPIPGSGVVTDTGATVDPRFLKLA